MVENCLEVFMDDLTVFGNSFDTCLDNLEKVLERFKEKGLVLNWEKMSFHDHFWNCLWPCYVFKRN